MKMRLILAIVCLFLFLTTGSAMADQISDMNQKIEKLEETINALKQELDTMKEKQQELAESAEEDDGEPSAAEIVEEAMSKNVTIGGHFKFFLADRTDGERNNVDQNNNFSAGVNDLWLYFSKSLNDWLSIEIVPRIEVLASATPGLGGDIRRSTSASVNTDLDEAFMTIRLPEPFDAEVRAGVFYPYFSEEYANRNWWHEQYHANNGLVTVENWETAGLEIYKNFDFDSFSLPIYFYPYLNGENRTRSNDSRFTDNNGDKNILLHLAPEAYLFGGRMRLLGSLGWGKWDEEGDNDSWQYALGADITWQGLNILGEYLYRGREDWKLSGGGFGDADDEAWYIRAMYTFNPKWRVLVKYSDADLFYASQNSMLTDNYKTVSAAVNYWITDGSTIIPQVEYVDAERSDGSEKLEYLRWTLGWRTTF